MGTVLSSENNKNNKHRRNNSKKPETEKPKREAIIEPRLVAFVGP